MFKQKDYLRTDIKPRKTKNRINDILFCVIIAPPIILLAILIYVATP